jgi:hypothetical protein
VTVYAAQALYRQHEPSTGADMVLRRVWTVSIHLRKFTLSTGQSLLGGSQQPLHRIRSVAFDGVPIIVQTAVAQDTEIELRGGLPLFAARTRCLMVLLCISAS